MRFRCCVMGVVLIVLGVVVFQVMVVCMDWIDLLVLFVVGVILVFNDGVVVWVVLQYGQIQEDGCLWQLVLVLFVVRFLVGWFGLVEGQVVYLELDDKGGWCVCWLE